MRVKATAALGALGEQAYQLPEAFPRCCGPWPGRHPREPPRLGVQGQPPPVLKCLSECGPSQAQERRQASQLSPFPCQESAGKTTFFCPLFESPDRYQAAWSFCLKPISLPRWGILEDRPHFCCLKKLFLVTHSTCSFSPAFLCRGRHDPCPQGAYMGTRIVNK